MTTYSIKDLEKLSGIKAHTVRIWEQRYNLFVPERSDTNIRSYNDKQVKKLLNIATLIQAGYKISKISAMSDEVISEHLESIYTNQVNSAQNYHAQINSLISAALDYNEIKILETLNSCIDQHGFEETFENILYPVLRKIGQLWRRDKMSPSQEHFLSCFVKQKLYNQIEQISLENSGQPTFLLFLPEWEDHEIGLLYGSLLLKRLSYNVVYLGSKVPARNLVDTVNTIKPDYLMTFMIGNVLNYTMNNYFKTLSEKINVPLLISGNQTIISRLDPSVKIKSFSSIHDFREFVNFA